MDIFATTKLGINAMRVKILVDASLVSIGGGVQVALNFIDNLLNDIFFDVILIASPQVSSQLSEDQKNKCYYFLEEVNESIVGKIKQGKRISKVEEKYKPNLVFVVFGPSYWRPKAPCLQGFALPLMVYQDTRDYIYNNNIKLKIYQKLLNYFKARMFKKNADYAVVETQTFKHRLSSFINFDDSKIFVVENSFNSNFLIDSDDHNKTLCQSDLLNIFIPSAYYPHKNLDILVDVAYFLKNDFNLKLKFNFLINKESENWGNIISLAKSKNVEEFFSTYGVVPNAKMKELYIINDFVLLPTLAEASTSVYPESFISQKVLLTSDIDFARELCGNAAVFFDPLNAYDIAEKIVATFKDQELQAQLIHNGLVRVKNTYLSPEQKWAKQKSMLLNLIGNLK